MKAKKQKNAAFNKNDFVKAVERDNDMYAIDGGSMSYPTSQ